MNNFFKTLIGKCFLYTLLCVCFFALSYSFISYISKDFFWFIDMLKSSKGKIALMQITFLNLLGGYVLYKNAIN